VNESLHDFLLIVAGVLIGGTVSFFITGLWQLDRFQTECVKRGVAAYDAQTGEWKWTVEPVKKEPAK